MPKINASEKYKRTQNAVVLSAEGYILTKLGQDDGSGWRTEAHKGWKHYETTWMTPSSSHGNHLREILIRQLSWWNQVFYT